MSNRSIAILGAGWLIYDTDTARPYIWRSWKTEIEAVRERLDLLKIYRQGHPWRRRLVVAEYRGPAVAFGTPVPVRILERSAKQ